MMQPPPMPMPMPSIMAKRSRPVANRVYRKVSKPVASVSWGAPAPMVMEMEMEEMEDGVDNWGGDEVESWPLDPVEEAKR